MLLRRPLLDLLLPLSARQPRLVPLLPVLVDLAADRWPRACLEVPDALNLQDLAVATLSVLDLWMGKGDASTCNRMDDPEQARAGSQRDVMFAGVQQWQGCIAMIPGR